MTDCKTCYYSFNNMCKQIRSNRGCFACENINAHTLDCNCYEVEDETHCKYYRDMEDDE